MSKVFKFNDNEYVKAQEYSDALDMIEWVEEQVSKLWRSGNWDEPEELEEKLFEMRLELRRFIDE